VITLRRAARPWMRVRPADATKVAPHRRSIRAEVGRRQGETAALGASTAGRHRWNVQQRMRWYCQKTRANHLSPRPGSRSRYRSARWAKRVSGSARPGACGSQTARGSPAMTSATGEER
jgi:hypothetical protein